MSAFWEGYIVGGLVAAVGGATFGHWIVEGLKDIPWRVRLERKDRRVRL